MPTLSHVRSQNTIKAIQQNWQYTLNGEQHLSQKTCYAILLSNGAPKSGVDSDGNGYYNGIQVWPPPAPVTFSNWEESISCSSNTVVFMGKDTVNGNVIGTDPKYTNLGIKGCNDNFFISANNFSVSGSVAGKNITGINLEFKVWSNFNFLSSDIYFLFSIGGYQVGQPQNEFHWEAFYIEMPLSSFTKNGDKLTCTNKSATIKLCHHWASNQGKYVYYTGHYDNDFTVNWSSMSIQGIFSSSNRPTYSTSTGVNFPSPGEYESVYTINSKSYVILKYSTSNSTYPSNAPAIRHVLTGDVVNLDANYPFTYTRYYYLPDVNTNPPRLRARKNAIKICWDRWNNDTLSYTSKDFPSKIPSQQNNDYYCYINAYNNKVVIYDKDLMPNLGYCTYCYMVEPNNKTLPHLPNLEYILWDSYGEVTGQYANLYNTYITTTQYNIINNIKNPPTPVNPPGPNGEYLRIVNDLGVSISGEISVRKSGVTATKTWYCNSGYGTYYDFEGQGSNQFILQTQIYNLVVNTNAPNINHIIIEVDGTQYNCTQISNGIWQYSGSINVVNSKDIRIY